MKTTANINSARKRREMFGPDDGCFTTNPMNCRDSSSNVKSASTNSENVTSVTLSAQTASNMPQRDRDLAPV